MQSRPSRAHSSVKFIRLKRHSNRARPVLVHPSTSAIFLVSSWSGGIPCRRRTSLRPLGFRERGNLGGGTTFPTLGRISDINVPSLHVFLDHGHVDLPVRNYVVVVVIIIIIIIIKVILNAWIYFFQGCPRQVDTHNFFTSHARGHVFLLLWQDSPAGIIRA